MSINPTGHHVLVELVKIDRVSPGGIILPDVEKEQKGAQYSKVLAVGPDAWGEASAPWAKVGDTIVTGRYPGLQFDFDGEYKLQRIINDDEVVAVVA